MKVRSARPQVRRLAESLGLDYPGMESDRFWLAEEDGRAQGIVGLMKHPDCLELVALGVAPQALSAEAQEDVFLWPRSSPVSSKSTLLSGLSGRWPD